MNWKIKKYIAMIIAVAIVQINVGMVSAEAEASVQSDSQTISSVETPLNPSSDSVADSVYATTPEITPPVQSVPETINPATETPSPIPAQGLDSNSFAGMSNLALNMQVTSSTEVKSPEYITDGGKDTASYSDIDSGAQWIQIDLKQSSDISGIQMWHYFGDSRTYKDVIVQISNDKAFNSNVVTVFNNDTDNSSGQGNGTDAEYAESKDGKTLTFSTVNGRYVRLWSNGSSKNSWNHYVEVEVYGIKGEQPASPPDLDNIALNCEVSSSSPIEGTAYIHDGKMEAAEYTSLDAGLQWVQIDLGGNYDISGIRLWHYFGDDRIYKDVIVQVSDDVEFKNSVKTLFNNDTDNSASQGIGKDQEYAESSSGKEIIAKTAVKARYVRLWSNGSSSNAWNHYSEIQIFSKAIATVTTEIPVLMYHSIRENPQDIYQLTPEMFDAQMKYLKDNGYTTLSLDEYGKMLKKTIPKSKKPILITFDDGWQDNVTVAGPILKKYGFKATIFVVANFINQENRVTEDQIRQWLSDGFDIGSHSLNHERLVDYNYAEQYDILNAAKKKIEAVTKKEQKYFAYPYGALNTDLISALDSLGYKLSFSSYEGFSSKNDNPFTQKRLFISGEYTLQDFIELIEK